MDDSKDIIIESHSKFERKANQTDLKQNCKMIKSVDDLRIQLNQELLKVLSEEKHKENERQDILDNCDDLLKKQKFERVFNDERLLASQRIIQMNK